MAGGVDTQGSVLRPQPWAGESQHLQSCRSLCKPLPEPSPRGGSSTSSPIPTLLKPLQGDGATTEAPSQSSPRGRSFNCWPIPAFFKGMELQRKPIPAFPRGRNTNCWPIPVFFEVKELQQKPLPTFHKGKERHPSALNTVIWDSRPLGRVGEGLQMGVILGLLPLAMTLEDYLPMTNSRVPPAMMSA